MSFTILIVGDNLLIRHALRFCIEQTQDWRVCGEAENAKVAVEKVKELQPDVVILDLQMPVMEGLEAAGQINVIAPNTAIVMLTMLDCEQLLKDAQATGISDVVSKFDGVAEHLLASLRRSHLKREDHLSMRTSLRLG